MKYIVILGDGMADYPIEELHGWKRQKNRIWTRLPK